MRTQYALRIAKLNHYLAVVSTSSFHAGSFKHLTLADPALSGKPSLWFPEIPDCLAWRIHVPSAYARLLSDGSDSLKCLFAAGQSA